VKVKYLEEDEIAAEAALLIHGYEKQFDVRLTPPVPIDEIAECHLDLDLRFVNLESRLKRKDVLGAIWIEEKRVAIDDSLDPTSYPSKVGRYRFTLAHEVGHWALHRSYFFARAQQAGLFGDPEEPSIVCRDGDSQPIEWQANAFAAHLLMPRQMVYEAWEQQQGTLKPYDASDEVGHPAPIPNGFSVPTVEIARQLARYFHVSAQAMQIRLTGIGFVRFSKGATALFEKWN
jgi:Zn-dependent peptidase ImmA (M78 family)